MSSRRLPPPGRRLALLGIMGVALLSSQPQRSPAQTVAEPPNRPAQWQFVDGHFTLSYGATLILDASVASSGPTADFRSFVDTAGGVVTQVFKWTALAGGRITVSGVVRGSAEAFAAEAEPRRDALNVVRHAIGPVDNRRNRALYDRRFDWLLSVDFPATAELSPASSADSTVAYRISASGEEVALRFRPRFYQRHRALAQYRPWTYQPWTGSVAGWTSWYAYFDKVTETDIRRTADVMSEVLRPFGYRYLQIDDGYQRTPIGVPAHWLETNEKFPGGLAALRRYLGERGLDAGIWTNASFQDRMAAEANPRWFVRSADGRPAYGNWVGFVMDASEPATIADLVAPVYRDLKAMGWAYYKLDALRHLRYEGYNSFAQYFAAKGLDREEVFRDFVRGVRGIIGRDAYLLACWGIRPELIGLVDGVRVGDDGFGYGSFAQYNSFNNVVWKNDPDHIELSKPDAFRAATLTSLTGSALMLTDPPEVYRTSRVEAAKRTAPVLFTRPGQLFDVDPSRSALLAQAGTSLSGAGPRPFDADQRLTVPLYQLDIARSFEQWTVLARTGGSDAPIALTELGLAGPEYIAFEFWTRAFLGVVSDSLRPGSVDPGYQVQVFCLRRRLAHPQVVATNRHVTCGGPDLADVQWRDGELAGVSELVTDDAYSLYLTEPADYRLEAVEVEGATVLDRATDGGLRVIRMRTGRGGRVKWRVRYAAR